MSDIAHQVCARHSARVAAARCLHCGRFFCRECITEHRGQVLCSACLAKTALARAKNRLRLTGLLRLLQWSLGLLFLWGCFYWLARMLLRIPASFHEGTLWRQGW